MNGAMTSAAGWTHTRPTECTAPNPRPFGELLRASFCRYCDQPVRVIPDPRPDPDYCDECRARIWSHDLHDAMHARGQSRAQEPTP